MRPLHALFVVLLLTLLGATALYLLRSEPGAGVTSAAAPIASERVSGFDRAAAGPEMELPKLTGGTSEGRERAQVASAAPAVETPGSSAHAGAHAGRARLRGRVVDEAGEPVEGARVLAGVAHSFVVAPLDETPRHFDTQRAETETAADGSFELSGPPAGPVRLAVRAAGFAPYDGQAWQLPDIDEYALDPIALEPGVFLEGRVLDALGRPVAEASVSTSPASGVFLVGNDFQTSAPAAILTDANGNFRIDQLGVGPYSFVVRSDEHPSAVFSGETQRPGEVRSGLVIELPRGDQIAGRITGVEPAQTRQLSVRATPKQDKRVIRLGGEFDPELEARTTEVRADGSFSLSGVLAEREYSISAFQQALAGFSEPFGRSVSPRVLAVSGARDVELSYQPESAVTFQVVDASTSAPIEELEVSAGINWTMRITGEGGQLLTSFPDGFVRAGGLRPAQGEQVTVSIVATGYEPWERTDIELGIGSELELGTIALEPVPVVRVRVVDRAAQPVEGARVTLAEKPEAVSGTPGRREIRREISIDTGPGWSTGLMGESRSARTDEQGWAELSSYEGRMCTLSVLAKGYAPSAAIEVELPTGRAFEQVIEVGPGGSVVVTVVDAEGLPVPSETVRQRPAGVGAPGSLQSFLPGQGGASNQDLTDARGVLRFDHLAPGEHEFIVGQDSQNQMFLGAGPGNANFSFKMETEGLPETGPEWVATTVVEDSVVELELVAPTRLALTGRILEGGQPLVGATLTLEERGAGDSMGMGLPRLPGMGPAAPSAKTNSQGNYEIPAVTEGEYTLLIAHPTRLMDASFEVEVFPGVETFDADLFVSILEGRVTNGAGDPLAGVRVEVEQARGGGEQVRMMFITVESSGGGSFSIGGPGGEPAYTDDEGRYSLRGVRSDVPLVVKAQGQGLQPAESQRVEVGPGVVKDGVDIVMQPGGGLVVEVFDARGDPAARIMLRANYAGEDYDDVGTEIQVTDTDGRTMFQGLVPGPWTISAREIGPEMDPEDDQEFSVDVVASEDRPVRLDLDR